MKADGFTRCSFAGMDDVDYNTVQQDETGRFGALAARRAWPAALLLAAALGACGVGGGAAGGSDGADRGMAEGARLYANRCSACHGEGLEGAFGPELRNIGERMTRDELIAVIRDGTGLMQGFRDRLTDEEIAAIADWIRNQ